MANVDFEFDFETAISDAYSETLHILQKVST